MKYLILVFFLALSVGCSASFPEKFIKTTLNGKELTADDFSIIVKNRIVPAFNTAEAVQGFFPGIHEEKKNRWQWTNIGPNSGSVELTNELENNEIRFVYFPRNKDGINTYAGLKQESLTIRGIGLGSPTRKTLEVYGKNDFATKHADSIDKGEIGFEYRYYGYPESAASRFPWYDTIEFESRDGIIVGIHYWRKVSDAE